jgi:hypothetical protein
MERGFFVSFHDAGFGSDGIKGACAFGASS